MSEKSDFAHEVRSEYGRTYRTSLCSIINPENNVVLFKIFIKNL